MRLETYPPLSWVCGPPCLENPPDLIPGDFLWLQLKARVASIRYNPQP